MSRLSYEAAAPGGLAGAQRSAFAATPTEAEKLAASIERAVRSETNGAIRDLVVEINREGVVLCGHCSTYYSKQMAQHAAMAVPSGGQIVNQIEVV